VIRGAAATDCEHILIEPGFHDNAVDEAFLKVDENLKKIAQAQAEIIFEFLGVKDMTVQEAEKIFQEESLA
jgi:N-acetylmuramoyl-L-alanine amidase